MNGRSIIYLCRILLLIFLAGMTPAGAQISYPEKRAADDDTREEIRQLMDQANAKYQLDMDSVLILFNQAQMLYHQNGDVDGVVYISLRKAFVFINIGQLAQARALLNLTSVYCNNHLTERKPLLALSWHKLKGNLFSLQGQPDSAFIHQERAIQIAGEIRDSSMLIVLYLDKAVTWIQNRQIANAIQELEQAEKISLKSNKPRDLVFVYLTFADAYSKIKDTVQMRLYTEKAMVYADRVNEKRIIYGLLANHAQKTGDYRKAVHYDKQALALADSSFPTSLVNPLASISVSYANLGDYEKAREYGEQALQLLEKDDQITYSSADVYRAMAGVYLELNECGKAMQALRIYLAMSDSLSNMERNTNIAQLEAMYRSADKDRQLLKQQEAIRARNTWIIACVTGIGIVILFLVIGRRNARKNIAMLFQQKEIEKLKAKIDGEEKERKRLARELHDGIGSLLSAAAIKINILEDGPDTAGKAESFDHIRQLIRKIGADVRETAHNLMPDVLLKNNLPEAIRHYCAYGMKHTHIEYSVQADGDFSQLHPRFNLSLYRIIQELIQNVLKHAAANSLFIELIKSDHLLTVTVEDDGRGMPAETTPNGAGLSNISERIRAYNGRLSINTSPAAGTSVFIEFDMTGIDHENSENHIYFEEDNVKET